MNTYAYVGGNPTRWIDPLGLRWWTGAGQVNNNSGGPITVTGDTKGGTEGSVTIPDGGSYNFNDAWVEVFISGDARGKLVDPDFIVYPDGTKEKIKPLPWNEVDVLPNPKDVDADGIPNNIDLDYQSNLQPKQCK